jgi:hypothetical protein
MSILDNEGHSPAGLGNETVAREAAQRLTNAAPDMLAALKAVLAAAESGFPEALQMARDAVGKAEGW